MSKYNQTHLDTGERRGSEGQYQVAACGYEAWGKRATTDEAQVTCPTCRGFIGRRLLAGREKAGEPALALVKSADHVRGSYRVAYDATLAGEHVGFVTFEGAFGKATWRVCALNRPTQGDRRLIGFQMDRDPDNPRSRPLSFPCKEDALLAIPALRAAGRLPTLAELEARHVDWQAREARWRVERAAKAQQAAEDRQTMLDGLDSLLARGDLTNLERAALVLLQRHVPKPPAIEEAA